MWQPPHLCSYRCCAGCDGASNCAATAPVTPGADGGLARPGCSLTPPAGGANAEQPPPDGLLLTPRLGPVTRTLRMGDSFGEITLLQRGATRSAT